jgi:DNA repair exonuclease SbcCD ATPase subunit
MKGLDRLSNTWVLAAVVLVLIGSAVIVGTVGSPANDGIAFELRKYLIQFLLIVALGAVVAFVVDGLKRKAESEERDRQRKAESEERDRQRKARSEERERQYAIDTLTSLLDRLDEIYREIKRERRQLRVLDMKTMSKQEYVRAGAQLSDDKQEVEKLWRDIEVLERWLPELEPVRPSVESMEKYLNPLETEWENVGSTTDEDFDAESLGHLRAFYVKWSDPESTFGVFREHYRKARSDLMSLLANERTGRGLASP